MTNNTYISAVTTADREEVIVFERTPNGRISRKFKSPLFFFIEDKDGSHEDLFGVRLKKLEFSDYESYSSNAKMLKAAGNKLWESDIGLEYKVLSQHYYQKPVSSLNVMFFDIEIDYDKTRGFDGFNDPYAPVSAISYYNTATKKMFLDAVPPTGTRPEDFVIPKELSADCEITILQNERQILERFLAHIEDSDIISGWNSEGFDVPYLYERLKLVLSEKAANRLSFPNCRKPYYKETVDKNGLPTRVLKISGRVHLDFMNLFFKFDPGGRDSFALDAVAEDVLKIKKIEYEGSLADLYQNEFIKFLEYNARDSVLLKMLEEARGYIQLAVLLSHMDCAQIEDVNGTVRLTESAIINYVRHELGKVVPDTAYDADPNAGKFGGAFVLPAKPGLHEWVASIDVNSLYPSAMRTVNISPDTLIGQFTKNDADYISIQIGSNDICSLRLENGEFISKPGKEWKAFLRNKKYSISGYGTVFDQNKVGVIPTLLASWFSDRKKYKKKMEQAKDLLELAKTDEEREKIKKDIEYYDKVQSVFKLKLNSTYGACGNKYFKFYDVRLAESTTKTGREILFHMARCVGEVIDGEYVYPNTSVIYGDTDSCYFSTAATNFEDACAVADYIEKFINKSFNKFSADKFLANPDFLNIFAVSQEIVANKAIFIDGKKNYMLRVLKKDGKIVDEIKITGLAIKKTTLPKNVRDILKGALSDYLRDTDWEIVGMRLLEAKEQLARSHIKQIGLPKKIKNLETYYDNYKSDASTTLPGHVAASIYWNECLEKYEDHESFKIKSGMRLNVFYFKKPMGRFKAIAVPVDLNKMPDWLMETFEPMVCKMTQASKLIDSPLKSILDAIGKEIPTRKKLLINEAFEY